MARKVKSITSDHRYPELVKKYRYDWTRFAVELVGKEPTWQQCLILDSAQETGSRTSVSSGHGTGKSDMTSIKILAYMILFPKSRTIIVANKIDQVMHVVWKYLRNNWNEICKRVPWIQQYFVLTDTTFYERAHKGIWQANPKGARLGNEEALAGEHAKHLFYIVDEASGVGDKAFGVMTGALTEEDNRMLLLSQPTRPSGYFYDTHHKLSTDQGGVWTSIKLNSEESPLVTVKFILEKRLEYGGREAPEYLIKVRGEFPKQIAGYLLGRDEADRAARANPTLAEDWGWVALCDVGNGRDKSVLNICKVSGQRNQRVLVSHVIKEMDGNVDPVRFADFIFAECSDDLYPNISIVVDGDGVGFDTATCCERYGMRVQRIRWGRPMHSTSDKRRFLNERAYANIMARDAVRQGRMRIDAQNATAEQASKIPCSINESGQWVMMPKKVMREKLNIKSPDRWDTYCFGMIAHYTPANMVLTVDMIERRSAVEDWVTAVEIEDV